MHLHTGGARSDTQASSDGWNGQILIKTCKGFSHLMTSTNFHNRQNPAPLDSGLFFALPMRYNAGAVHMTKNLSARLKQIPDDNLGTVADAFI